MVTETLATFLRTLPGRCTECLAHIETQGHSGACGVGIRGGAERRRRGHEHLDASDSNDENGLLREQIINLARDRDTFSANDLPGWVRERTHPNRRGRMFSQLLDEGVLVSAGEVRSSNPRAHGKRVALYRMGNAA